MPKLINSTIWWKPELQKIQKKINEAMKLKLGIEKRDAEELELMGTLSYEQHRLHRSLNYGPDDAGIYIMYQWEKISRMINKLPKNSQKILRDKNHLFFNNGINIISSGI